MNMPPSTSDDKGAAATERGLESPVNAYRQFARLNRDPFSQISREKQKVLLLAASVTIIIKLSLMHNQPGC
jgi:hypothetical protein